MGVLCFFLFLLNQGFVDTVVGSLAGNTSLQSDIAGPILCWLLPVSTFALGQYKGFSFTKFC